MIIHDPYIVRMAVPPHKADPPLVIDSNRVLAFPVAAQGLQWISRWGGQNMQLGGSVQLEQFPQADPLDGSEPPAVMVVKEFLCFLGAKALNHIPRYNV